MAFWTLQSKDVVKKAKEDGIFYPDFSFSPQQHIIDYNRVLEAFNSLNKTNYKGLIFCLAPEPFLNREINEYQSIDEIKELFSENTNIRDSFATEPYSLFDNEHVLLKIDGKEFENVNTIPIDYWNHIIVMDGGSPEIFEVQKVFSVFCNMDYEVFEQLIFESIKQGKYIRPIMETSRFEPYKTMTETHIPYIKHSSILEIHEASQLI